MKMNRQDWPDRVDWLVLFQTKKKGGEGGGRWMFIFVSAEIVLVGNVGRNMRNGPYANRYMGSSIRAAARVALRSASRKSERDLKEAPQKGCVI